MRTYTYREMDMRLRELGWKEIRCKGSHHQYGHPAMGSIITVPGRRSSEILSDNVVKNIERYLCSVVSGNSYRESRASAA